MIRKIFEVILVLGILVPLFSILFVIVDSILLYKGIVNKEEKFKLTKLLFDEVKICLGSL